jgi:hypothetical protein
MSHDSVSPSSPLLHLPAEILHHVLAFLPSVDLLRARHACRELQAFIETNALLYKEVYLQELVRTRLSLLPSRNTLD